MTQPLCFLNGEMVPIVSASLPISDLGFIHGVTVTEQMRTLGGKPFLLQEHIRRFQSGLDLLRIQLDEPISGVGKIVDLVASQFLNHSGNVDCGIGFFASPGSTGRFGQPATKSLFCVYAYELPFAEWKDLYRSGCSLKVSEIKDVDSQSWPKHVKIRSRLHYYLADLYLNRIESRDTEHSAILTDRDGFLRDTSTAAPFFVFEPNQISLPPKEDILDSVTLEFVVGLASGLGINVERRRIHQSEISQLRGMALANSLYCLAKVRAVNEKELPMNSPEVLAIISAWKDQTGVDFEV